MNEMQPIHVGIAGLGRAGWAMHRKEIEGSGGRFRIVAACDVIGERAARLSEAVGCAVRATVGELIADPAVELVDIATRSPDHVPHALAALEAGKNVFLEKPISLTKAGAERLRAAAGRSKGNLYIRHNRRFEPAFRHIQEIIASGILGWVYEIKLRRNGYQRRADWQTIIASGGGQLLNWGPHIVDHALMFLESPVADMWSDLKRIAAVGDAEDHLKIVLKGANGRVVDMEISGGSALREPEYIVSGAKGALRCEGNTIALRYIDPEAVLSEIAADNGTPPQEGGFGNREEVAWIEREIPVEPSDESDTTDIWRYLYEAIREGKPYPITLDQAVAVMEVIDRAKAGTPFRATATDV